VVPPFFSSFVKVFFQSSKKCERSFEPSHVWSSMHIVRHAPGEKKVPDRPLGRFKSACVRASVCVCVFAKEVGDLSQEK